MLNAALGLEFKEIEAECGLGCRRSDALLFLAESRAYAAAFLFITFIHFGIYSPLLSSRCQHEGCEAKSGKDDHGHLLCS